jgi:hypothetical protein
LGIKELHSLRRDPVLVILILYTFTFAIYSVANGVKTEVLNASIAFIDEDGSELLRRRGFCKPSCRRRLRRISPASPKPCFTGARGPKSSGPTWRPWR